MQGNLAFIQLSINSLCSILLVTIFLGSSNLPLFLLLPPIWWDEVYWTTFTLEVWEGVEIVLVSKTKIRSREGLWNIRRTRSMRDQIINCVELGICQVQILHMDDILLLSNYIPIETSQAMGRKRNFVNQSLRSWSRIGALINCLCCLHSWIWLYMWVEEDFQIEFKSILSVSYHIGNWKCVRNPWKEN